MASMPMDIPNVSFYFFDHSLGMMFLWKHQNLLQNMAIWDFDILVFAEDDVLISKDNFDYFAEHSEELKGTEYLPGLISYENWDDCRCLHSMRTYSWKMGQAKEINGKRYWTVSDENRLFPNVHQCCYLLDKERFEQLASENKFPVEPELFQWGRRNRFLGPRESASCWLWALYYKKAWALDDLDRAFVLHDDHYKHHPIGPTIEQFKAEIAA